MKMTLSDLLDATAGELVNPCVDLSRKLIGITWDSREVSSDMVFLALPGERVDGHDYIIQAASAGARAIVVSRAPSKREVAVASELECALVRVADTQAALRDLATAWRRVIRSQVVAITGSVGKTTTKDLTASVCRTALRTVATAGNRNNELGVPSTVLEADFDTEALIVEMGMRAAGQITDLCSYVKPTVGVITNIGVTHMELLGSQDNIALAKGELIASLPPSGTAVLPGDDPYTPFIREHRPCDPLVKVLTFGRGEGCDVRAVDVTVNENGACSFMLVFPDGMAHPLTLRIPGQKTVDDALAAATVGYALGIPADRIVEGLLTARSSSMRFETLHAACGATLINDAYNANPDSMRAALSTLADMKVAGRRLAVLGDMGELGPDEERFHREVGIFAARSGLESLFCVGDLAHSIASAAVDGGMDPASVRTFDGVADALEYLTGFLKPSDTVLFKASRSMGFERIVKGLE